jgi:hypothetical protein
MSWKKKDWLKFGGLLALGGTGLGLAGVGPLAGLLGGAGVAGGAGAAATLPGGLSAGAALGEGLTATAGGTGVLNGGLLGGAGLEKGLKGLQMASKFAQMDQPQQIQPAPMPRAPQLAADNEALKRLLKLYGGYQV